MAYIDSPSNAGAIIIQDTRPCKHIGTIMESECECLIDPYEGEQVDTKWDDYPSTDNRISEQGDSGH